MLLFPTLLHFGHCLNDHIGIDGSTFRAAKRRLLPALTKCIISIFSPSTSPVLYTHLPMKFTTYNTLSLRFLLILAVISIGLGGAEFCNLVKDRKADRELKKWMDHANGNGVEILPSCPLLQRTVLEGVRELKTRVRARGWKCKTCLQVFVKESTLESHIMEIHQPNGVCLDTYYPLFQLTDSCTHPEQTQSLCKQLVKDCLPVGYLFEQFHQYCEDMAPCHLSIPPYSHFIALLIYTAKISVITGGCCFFISGLVFYILYRKAISKKRR